MPDPDTISYPTEDMQDTSSSMSTTITDAWTTHSTLLKNTIVIPVSNLKSGGKFHEHITDWDKNMKALYDSLANIAKTLDDGQQQMGQKEKTFEQNFEHLKHVR